MTYFGFLARFLLVPIAILLPLVVWQGARGRYPDGRRAIAPAWVAVLAHVVVAVAYTTPWDNYLVATGVWWYEEYLVTGLTIGWVPIEEYTFFVLQSVLTGLLLLALRPALPPEARPAETYTLARPVGGVAAGAVWLGGVLALVGGRPQATYAGLQLAWALPPLVLQLAFGADILWRRRRLVASTLALSTVYLAVTDTLAIDGGTWTIDPGQSFGVLLGGVLPLEEFTFFLLTNALLVFGITLMLAPESVERLPLALRRRAPWGRVT